MNKIFEEILWEIYYYTESGLPKDGRFFLVNEIIKDIHGATGKQLHCAISALKNQKLIEKKKYEDSILISLSEKGMLRVLNHKFRKLDNKKEKWDGRWRMVAFDIPNSQARGRKALAYRLKMGGFYKLQESVFLYPYDCQKEINAFTKLFKIEKYVRFGTMDFIDIQDKLKFHYKISS